MLNRGYFYPPLEQEEIYGFNSLQEEFSRDIPQGCPQDDDIVGFDFGLKQLICANDKKWGTSGPLCEERQHISVGEDGLSINLNGKNICQDYTSFAAESVSLHGPLFIHMPENFSPSALDEFVIIKTRTRASGKFRNDSHGLSAMDKGFFRIKYQETAVVLYNFTPRSNLAKPRFQFIKSLLTNPFLNV